MQSSKVILHMSGNPTNQALGPNRDKFGLPNET
jgi:hypothetical protein